MISMRSPQLSYLRCGVYKGLTIWPLVTQNDLWPPPKTKGITYLIWLLHMLSITSLTFTLLEILCLQAFSKIFIIWPLVTPNELWPPPKTIEIIYLIWVVHMLSMRSLRLTLLEISCLQGFDLFTSGDPKWPLTSTKNNRDYLLNMANPHAKYDIPHIHFSWDIVFTSIFQGFHHLTSGDPKWPLTSTENYRDHLLNMGSPHARY